MTHKKKWGEYLLESFMLFLAVFLGFIAENMREIGNLCRQSDTTIRANILNLPGFNREETMNIFMFYKTMIKSSRTLQMADYIKTNAGILEVLRKDYDNGVN